MAGEQRVRLAVGDDASLAHHHDAVGQQHRLEDIVRRHDGGEAHALVQPAALRAERIARDRVECAERLIHQQDAGPRRERARDPDPLALPAGELGGAARQVAPRQRHQIDQLLHARADALLAPTHEPRRDADVLRNTHVREQPDALEHITDAPAQLVRGRGARGLPIDEHGARIGLEQAIDGLQQRGLAGPGVPDDGEEGLGRHLETDLPDGPAGAAIEGFRDALERDHEGTRNTCASAPRPTRT